MRVQPNVIRILDLCILNYKADPDSAPTTPPLLAVEIISKDDSYTDVLTKLREYHQWGVRNIWLIDPRLGQLAQYGAAGLLQMIGYASDGVCLRRNAAGNSTPKPGPGGGR